MNGFDAVAVPVTAQCPASNGAGARLITAPRATMSDTFTLRPNQQLSQSGFVQVLAATRQSSGQVALALETVKPPVPSCLPDIAASGVQLIGAPQQLP